MTKEQALDAVEKAIDKAFERCKELSIHSVSQQRELLLSAICQFTKRNTQKEIKEVEKWIESDFRK